MKVLMQGKVDLLESGGGDKVQIENTAKELRLLGVEVDIIPGFKVDYDAYDLVHLFQLDWTPETYIYAKNAKKAGKKIILSPIHHSVHELKKFDDEYVFDFRRVARIFFKDQFKRDTLKNIYKSFFDTRKAYPTFVSMLLGLKKMQKRTLEMADVVLVQTELEANDLKETYGVDFKWKKVVNGVGRQFINASEKTDLKNPFGMENYILCVGRIEARKNQINIIKAVELFRKKHKLDTQLVFVGRKSQLKHFEYIYRFNRKVAENDWVHHFGEVPWENMPAVYKHAKVSVSASWFETTGLTSLEALYCGTNAVAAGVRAKEYLGANVSYCEPNDVDSIEKAISAQYFAERPTLSGDILEQYTWQNAAKKTLEIYESILKNNL